VAETPTPWASIALPALPTGVSTAIEGVAALGNTTVAALNIVSTFLDVIANLTIETDPVKAALSLTITAIQEGLDALLEDAGVFVLFVPVTRKVIVSPLMQDALAAVGMSAPPPMRADLDILGLQARLVGTSPATIAALQSGSSGGNTGFLRVVADSVMDSGDPNRPQLGTTDYVAGIHFVAGASDYVQLLSLLTALDGIMLPDQANTSLAVAGLPVPQNLRVTPGLKSAYLSWDAQAAYFDDPSLDMSGLITHVAVIRSTNPTVLTSATPLSLFGTTQLTEGQTAIGDADTKVVKVIPYTKVLVPNTYEDTGLTTGTTYYYFTAYRFKIGTLLAASTQKSLTDQGYYKFSNVATCSATTKPTRSGRGTPPDWIRTPSALDLIPAARDLLTLLNAQLAQFQASTGGNATLLKKYVTYLQAEIAKLSATISTLTGLVQRLAALSSQTPTAGLYARVFSGKGGTDYMIGDLGNSLASSNPDPNRPPFDRGDEFVAGVVVLAGGPSEDAVLKVKTMLGVLFGAAQSTLTTPLQQALAGIDVALGDLEALAGGTTAPIVTPGFNDDFSTTPELGAGTSGTGALTDGSTLTPGASDVSLSDDDPGSCAADTTPAPTFGEDFGVTT
jgi:hypothetical protein